MTHTGRRTSTLAASLARTLALTGALATGFAPRASVAHAQDARPKLTESQKQEIRDRYSRAERFYYLRKFAEAIVEYEAIYLLSADPVMLYNIAQCHRQADQPEQAAQFYKNYLRNAPTASNRADVEKKIVDMERLVEERRRAGGATRPTPTPPRPTPGPTTPPPVTVPPPTATTPPPVSTTPPPADLPVGAPPPAGPDPTSPAAPSPGAPAPEQPDLGATQPAQPEPPSRVLPLSLVVGGGVFLATSLVLGGVAASKAREVESAARTRMRTFDGGLQSTQRAGRAASGLAVASGLIGTIALGAGLYYLFWRLPDGAAPEVATAGGAGPSRGDPVMNPAIVPVFVPVIGPGYAGAQAQVTF